MKHKKIIFIFTLISLLNFNLFANNVNTFKIGVNRFAWIAALQSVNFMPLLSADPFGGAILSDWYAVNENERYKIDVYVLEEYLTSETVSVKVFKQKKQGNSWVDDTNNSKDIALKIEDAILNTARQLKINYAITK
jgi:hypothetical protein